MSTEEQSSDPLTVSEYEVDMFRAMCHLLQDGDATYAALNDHIQNAIVESALLHGRILADILLSRGNEPDDINLEDIAPNFTSADLNQLREFHGTARTENSPCWTLNKMLAHPTLLRGSSFDYSPVLNQLAPIILRIVQELCQRRA